MHENNGTTNASDTSISTPINGGIAHEGGARGGGGAWFGEGSSMALLRQKQKEKLKCQDPPSSTSSSTDQAITSNASDPGATDPISSAASFTPPNSTSAPPPPPPYASVVASARSDHTDTGPQTQHATVPVASAPHSQDGSTPAVSTTAHTHDRSLEVTQPDTGEDDEVLEARPVYSVISNNASTATTAIEPSSHTISAQVVTEVSSAPAVSSHDTLSDPNIRQESLTHSLSSDPNTVHNVHTLPDFNTVHLQDEHPSSLVREPASDPNTLQTEPNHSRHSENQGRSEDSTREAEHNRAPLSSTLQDEPVNTNGHTTAINALDGHAWTPPADCRARSSDPNTPEHDQNHTHSTDPNLLTDPSTFISAPMASDDPNFEQDSDQQSVSQAPPPNTAAPDGDQEAVSQAPPPNTATPDGDQQAVSQPTAPNTTTASSVAPRTGPTQDETPQSLPVCSPHAPIRSTHSHYVLSEEVQEAHLRAAQRAVEIIGDAQTEATRTLLLEAQAQATAILTAAQKEAATTLAAVQASMSTAVTQKEVDVDSPCPPEESMFSLIARSFSTLKQLKAVAKVEVEAWETTKEQHNEVLAGLNQQISATEKTKLALEQELVQSRSLNSAEVERRIVLEKALEDVQVKLMGETKKRLALESELALGNGQRRFNNDIHRARMSMHAKIAASVPSERCQFDNVPDSLLAVIFSFVLEEPYDTPNSLSLIARVCQTWRRVAATASPYVLYGRCWRVMQFGMPSTRRSSHSSDASSLKFSPRLSATPSRTDSLDGGRPLSNSVTETPPPAKTKFKDRFSLKRKPKEPTDAFGHLSRDALVARLRDVESKLHAFQSECEDRVTQSATDVLVKKFQDERLAFLEQQVVLQEEEVLRLKTEREEVSSAFNHRLKEVEGQLAQARTEEQMVREELAAKDAQLQEALKDFKQQKKVLVKEIKTLRGLN